MAEKHGDLQTKIAGAIAAAAAGFVAKKVVTFAWTRITGKAPPDDPNDPQVALAEAIGFAVVMGVGLQVARLLATRAAAKRLAAHTAEPAG
jgi:Protein of unknown function (DUF4235)